MSGVAATACRQMSRWYSCSDFTSLLPCRSACMPFAVAMAAAMVVI